MAGLFSDRPSPGDEGRKFIATDKKLLYIDNGSSWETVCVVIEPRTSDPSSPVKGQQWMDDSGNIKYYDGAEIQQIGSGGWTY